ncbi:MAG: O-antigen ligase family protein [Rickettsiales bacterium]|nr:O-antigen ligase family protein [Rickettsiales bacterium]
MNLTLAALTLALLQNSFTDAYWLPSSWPDYLGFVALCLLITLTHLLPWQKLTHRIAYYFLCGTIVLCSESLLAMIVWGAIGFAITAYYLLSIKIKKLDPTCYKRLLLCGTLIPIIYSLSCLMPDGYQALYGILTGTQPSDLQFYNSSSGTRVLFGAITWEALLANPSYWLTGAGWGHFTDALFAHPFIANVSNTPPNWAFTSGTAFHSHNNYLEALYSTGLIGLICFAALPFLAIRHNAPPTLIWAGTAWIGLSILLGAWFMLGICLPFFAIALAVSIPPKTTKVQTSAKSKYVLQTLLTLSAASFLYLAVTHYQDAHKGRTYMDAIKSGVPHARISAPNDHHRLWWVSLNFADYLNKKRDTRTLSFTTGKTDIAWFSEILYQLDNALPENSTKNTRLRSLRAHMINDLIVYYSGAHWNHLRAKARVNWHHVLWSSIKANPSRGDIAAPYYQYFLNQLNNAKEAKQEQYFGERILLLTETVLKEFPQDPTALWYSGKVLLLLSPNQQAKANARIEKAVQLGIEKRFYVSSH